MVRVNKKGITRGSLILLLLVFALVVGFMFIARGTAFALTKQSDVQICRTSASQGSWSFEKKVLFVKIIDIDSPVRLNCKTQYIDLEDDEILFGDHTKKLSGNPEDDKNKLKELVFEQLSECWYQFGEGRTAVQKASKVDSACVICSEIIPDNDFVENYAEDLKLKLDDLYSYAGDHEGVAYNANKDYMSYLTGDGDMPQFTTSPDKSIKFDKPYYVVFQVVNKNVADAKVDSGVVDCSVAGKTKKQLEEYKMDVWATALVASAYGETGMAVEPVLEDVNGHQIIGCDGAGNIDGINFGKVIGVGDDKGTLTVRIVPASGITAENCQRLI